MKNTFDSIIDGSREFIGAAAEKAADVVNVSKSYVERASLKLKLDDKYRDLGRLCYHMHKTGSDESGGVKAIIKEIKSMEGQLEMAEEITGKPKICAFCGRKNSSDNVYCSGCGEKLGNS